MRLYVKNAKHSDMLYYPAASQVREHSHANGGGYKSAADLIAQAFERWGNNPFYMLRIIPNGIERIQFAGAYTQYFDLRCVREHVMLTIGE